jgi:CBS domain-containing protein
MKAADVMTSDVVSVLPTTSVSDIAKLMIERRISGVPVIGKSGNLVGIVSEGDLLRRAETETERHRSRWLELLAPTSTLAAEYVKSHGRTAKEVMTRDVVTVAESATLAEIADLLESRRIKRVPVLRDGKVVGIVSRSNLLQAFASEARKERDVPTDDRAIRETLVAELRRQKWADPTESNIVVSHGVVHLWGVVFSTVERKALHVAAERIPGVRGVRDHLVEAPIYPAL